MLHILPDHLPVNLVKPSVAYSVEFLQQSNTHTMNTDKL